jgi:histidinol-phosphate aminotransferase
VCDPAVAALLNIVQEPFNVNRVALAAGRTAVGMPDFVGRRRAQVAAARDAFAEALAESGIEVVPSQSNFVLLRLGVDERPVCGELMRRGILVRPGSTLGLPGYVRVTMAPDELVRTTAAAIAAAVAGAAT